MTCSDREANEGHPGMPAVTSRCKTRRFTGMFAACMEFRSPRHLLCRMQFLFPSAIHLLSSICPIPGSSPDGSHPGARCPHCPPPRSLHPSAQNSCANTSVATSDHPRPRCSIESCRIEEVHAFEIARATHPIAVSGLAFSQSGHTCMNEY